MSSSLQVTHSGLGWDEFKHEIYSRLVGERAKPERGTFIFRGQRDAAWGLVSSFDRLGGSLNTAARQRAYSEQMRRFKATVERFGLVSLQNYLTRGGSLGDAMYEVVGQHHGLPTRLLDWSFSPYVAAYFAYFQMPAESDEFASVWALDQRQLALAVDDNNCRIVDTSLSGVDRITAQQGIFTQNHSIFSDLVELVGNVSTKGLQALNRPILHQFTLRSSDAGCALEDLSLMGIDQIRLFPGLEGICSSLRDDLVRSTN